MTAHLPPVPPEQRPRHGEDPQSPQGDAVHKTDTGARNTKEEDRQGNVNQNTHNKGYQQDR